MDTPPISLTCAQCARKLGDLVAQLPVNDIEETWKEVESTAQQLANGLRVRDGPGEGVMFTARLRGNLCVTDR
jgi:hypothetical protein